MDQLTSILPENVRKAMLFLIEVDPLKYAYRGKIWGQFLNIVTLKFGSSYL